MKNYFVSCYRKYKQKYIVLLILRVKRLTVRRFFGILNLVTIIADCFLRNSKKTKKI